MFSALTRRDFVANTVKAGALAGLGDFAFLRNLTPVSAADAKVLPAKAQVNPDIEPLDNWDEEGADRAIAALVRQAGAEEVIELFWRYGARDFRDIGHKAIFAANAWRTMQAIGWRHAEPVMRSLTYALLEHSGGNPAKGDAEADRPWRENVGRAGKIRANWQRGTLKPEAGAELLAALRTASASEASAKVVELLNKEIDPSCLW